MIAGKGNFRMIGGYLHAAFHVIGTALVLWLLDFSPHLIIVVAIAEFAVHYMLDFAKVHYSAEISSTERPRAFWALNGLDQLLHQLTYVGIVYFALISTPN